MVYMGPLSSTIMATQWSGVGCTARLHNSVRGGRMGRFLVPDFGWFDGRYIGGNFCNISQINTRSYSALLLPVMAVLLARKSPLNCMSVVKGRFWNYNLGSVVHV